MEFKIGDKVIYDGVVYTIEREYCEGVFRIGNKNSFVDMVNEDMIKHYQEKL